MLGLGEGGIYRARLGVREPKVAVGVDFEVVETVKGLLVVVVEQHGLLEGDWVDLHESARLVGGPISHSIVGVIVEDTAVKVDRRRVGGDFAERIVTRVEQVLPSVHAVITAWRAPLDE